MSKSSLGVITATSVAVLLFLGGFGWWYRTSRPEYRYRVGCEAASTGDFPRANRQAEALEESGQTDLALLVRAEIEFHQGSADRALGFLRKIQAEGEVQKRSILLTARCLIALKNTRDAERALLTAVAIDPDSIDAHRWLAGIYYDQGDFRLALPQMQQVADLDPTDEKPHYWMGLIYKDTDKPAEAVAAFEESIRRRPEGPKSEETRLLLAEMQIKNMRHADALQTLGERNSDRAVALRAEAMVAVGQGAAAVPLLDAALASSPKHPGLLRQRAERYREAGDPGSAAKLLERAVAVDPHDFRSRSQLALCYSALGQDDKAAEQQKKVKESQALFEQLNQLGQNAMNDPWDANVRTKLADLCEQINQPKLAAMWRDAAAACRTQRMAPGTR